MDGFALKEMRFLELKHRRIRFYDKKGMIRIRTMPPL
jgi:hypothetical protein